MKSSRRPTLLHALEHHAKDKAEVASAIALVFTTMFAPRGWQIRNLKGGANSWMIFDPARPNRQYHFRNGGKGTIMVRRNWYGRAMHQKPEFLSSRVDVIRWAEKALA